MGINKSPEAFRTISEAGEMLLLPSHVLRFWESKFPQIKPVKRAGGRRFYRPNDILLLFGIKKLLHGNGMTIVGVKRLIKDNGIKYLINIGQETKRKSVKKIKEDDKINTTINLIKKYEGQSVSLDRIKLGEIKSNLFELRSRILERIKTSSV